MEARTRETIRECARLSFAGEITFPEVVRRLAAEGVERYHVDLVGLETAYYDATERVEKKALPLEGAPPIAERFSEEGVRQALAAVQAREIDYPEFLRRILAAGTVAYTVFFKGRHVLYAGRDGGFHVERFPGEPPH